MFSEGAILIFLHLSICATQSNAISKCQITEKSGLSYVNCSSRGLEEVPELPRNAFFVDLSRNNIKKIVSDSTFSGMKQLSYLDLSDNPLDCISTGIFNGLTNLTDLHIRNSYLGKRWKDLILDSVLFGLKNLKHFSFTFKLVPKSFPTKCPSQPFGKVDSLDSIEALEIDTALLKWKSKGSYRETESKTKYLYLIYGFCYDSDLKLDQFDLPFLENFTMESPYRIPNILPAMFDVMEELKVISIYGPRHSDLPFIAPENFLFTVAYSMWNRLKIESFAIYDIYKNVIVKCGSDFLPLHDKNSLRTISLVGNGITKFSDSDNCLPASLKNFYVQRNCLSNYDINFLLGGNSQVEVLEASDQNSCGRTDANRTTVSRSDFSFGRKIYSLRKLIITYTQNQLHFGNVTDYFENLTYLDLSHNEKVENHIPPFFSSSRPNLKYLDMSHSFIVSLHAHSFDNVSELQHLDLSWNKLGSMGCSLSERFRHMKALVELDLSKNNIKCVPLTMFQSMRRLKKIDLSANEIQTFDADLKELKALTCLDISYNRLQKLPDDIVKTLDLLTHSHVVQMNLEGNVLLCTCETIGFLHWLASTEVKLTGRKNYTCSYSDGTTTKLEDIKNIIETLTTECTPKTTLIVGISIVVAFCLTAIVTVIVYRCRWILRYWYYKFRINTFYQTRGHKYERIFEFDMFISYSSEDHEIARQGVMDELESKRGLRCCIHERDFLPGESIAYNIARGIRESKRTALFLSKSFLKSEWCLYELNIARMEALHTERNVMLVIMLETIDPKALPLDILDVIKTFTYIEYPIEGTVNDLETFWSKCADFAKD